MIIAKTKLNILSSVFPETFLSSSKLYVFYNYFQSKVYSLLFVSDLLVFSFSPEEFLSSFFELSFFLLFLISYYSEIDILSGLTFSELKQSKKIPFPSGYFIIIKSFFTAFLSFSLKVILLNGSNLFAFTSWILNLFLQNSCSKIEFTIYRFLKCQKTPIISVS